MAFATLPRIKICGHDDAYEALQSNLIKNGFENDMLVDIISTLQSHYNCLGLTCGDVGRHYQLDASSPECFDDLDLAGYVPVNADKTNMVSCIYISNDAEMRLLTIYKSLSSL